MKHSLNFARLSQRARLLLSALLLSLTLTACGGSSSLPGASGPTITAIETRHLPPVPTYARPAHVDDIKVGEPLAVYAGRERAGRLANERVIISLMNWAGLVKKCYANRRC